MAIIYLDRPVQPGDPVGSVYDPTRAQTSNLMGDEDILQTDFIINPTQGRGLSGVATSVEPLLQQGSQLSDVQEVEPGVFLDRTSVTSVNDLFNYYFGGMPSQQPVAETPAETTPQAPILDTPTESQETGDTVDQPLVESGEFGGQPTFTTTPGTTVDSITGDIIRPDGSYGGNIVDEFLPVSGTFGGNEVLTTTTGTQIDSETGDITAPDGSFAGNIVDEFGTAGDVYSGAQGPTGIGTGDVLDEFGTAGDVYSGAPTSGGIVDEVALTGGLGAPPSIESLQPPAIQEPLITPTDILLTGLGGLLDVPLNLGITAAQAAMPTQPDLVDPTVNIDEFAEEDNVNVGTNQQTPGEQLGAGDPLDDFEVSGGVAPGGAAQVFDTAFGSEDSGSDTSTSESTVDEADVEAGLATESISDFTSSPAPDAVTGDSGGSSGGGKIVCTMMNDTYGFGSFRNKIWLKQSKDLAPEYQKGYHILFLPLVKIAETNKIVRKILEHIAVHRTIDIRQESRGKTHMLGRIYRKILEPICYWVGKYAKR